MLCSYLSNSLAFLIYIYIYTKLTHTTLLMKKQLDEIKQDQTISQITIFSLKQGDI